MNTERLFEFQVLAQTLHYGLAASKLYISQSVLSRHIQSLEHELGIQLFTRTSHSVSLTSSGIAFYRLSQDYLKDVNNAAENARIANMGLKGSVKAGFMMPTMSDKIRDFLIRFGERYPDIFVSADVLTTFEPSNLSEYHYLTLASSAMVTPYYFELYAQFPEKGSLILPMNHHITPGSTVSLSEFENEILFLPGYSRNIGSYARIGQLAREATENRIRIVSVANPETALLNVEMGRGFTVLPKHRARNSEQQVRYADIVEDCSFETILMRNKNFDSSEDEIFGKDFVRVMNM